MNLSQKTTVAVLTAHALLIVGIAINHKSTPPSQSQTIAVNTYVYSPPPAPKKTIPIQQPLKPKPKQTKEVIRDLQKSIAKIDAKRDKRKVTKQPKPAQLKQMPHPQYPVLLSQVLKKGLHLPEEGDVKLALTLNRQGEIVEMKILNSDSAMNAKYLEDAIMQLRFPPFTRDIIHKKQHTFTLTFCHDQ